MKCIISGCGNEIDDKKEFRETVQANGEKHYDLKGQREHAAALETWQHVIVSVPDGGATRQVLGGHVCPSHKLTSATESQMANFSITFGGK